MTITPSLVGAKLKLLMKSLGSSIGRGFMLARAMKKCGTAVNMLKNSKNHGKVIETCPMCGEVLKGSIVTITEDDFDHFCLDIGTVVHKECFEMESSREPECRWWHDW